MAKNLRVGRGNNRPFKKTVSAPRTKTQEGHKSGAPVFFFEEGFRVAGVFVKSVSVDNSCIELVLPDASGILHRTGSQVMVPAKSLEAASDIVVDKEARKVKAWAATLETEMDTKALMSIHRDDDEAKPIIDYRNVVIEGFLSTFVGTTSSDRDGDFVMEGAFNDTLAQFRRNPVMLMDHRNSVPNLAGSFNRIGVNSRGLAVRGTLSNAPGLIDTRFKIVEGHLKGLSMGGLFFFDRTGRGIEKVDLFEGSLTPVPANPDTMFEVRSLTIQDAVKAYKIIQGK